MTVEEFGAAISCISMIILGLTAVHVLNISARLQAIVVAFVFLGGILATKSKVFAALCMIFFVLFLIYATGLLDMIILHVHRW